MCQLLCRCDAYSNLPCVGLLARRSKEDLFAVCQLLAAVSPAISYLRREHELITGPSQFLQGLTHFDLALSSCVHFGSVECVDAMVPGCLHAVLDDGAFLGSTVGQPSS
jgi:hypothetical protein